MAERQGHLADLAVGLVAVVLLQAWEAAEILQRPRLQQFKVIQVGMDQTLRLTMAAAEGVVQTLLREQVQMEAALLAAMEEMARHQPFPALVLLMLVAEVVAYTLLQQLL